MVDDDEVLAACIVGLTEGKFCAACDILSADNLESIGTEKAETPELDGKFAVDLVEVIVGVIVVLSFLGLATKLVVLLALVADMIAPLFPFV